MIEGAVLLALIVGGIAAAALPLLSFTLALTIMAVAGAAAAALLMTKVGAGLAAVGIVFLAAQVGYGLGFAAIALIGPHLKGRGGAHPSSAPVLRQRGAEEKRHRPLA